MREKLQKRINMWVNCRRIFGSWLEFLEMTGIRMQGKTRRIRKKRAKAFMESVIGSDLYDQVTGHGFGNG